MFPMKSFVDMTSRFQSSLFWGLCFTLSIEDGFDLGGFLGGRRGSVQHAIYFLDVLRVITLGLCIIHNCLLVPPIQSYVFNESFVCFTVGL